MLDFFNSISVLSHISHTKTFQDGARLVQSDPASFSEQPVLRLEWFTTMLIFMVLGSSQDLSSVPGDKGSVW